MTATAVASAGLTPATLDFSSLRYGTSFPLARCWASKLQRTVIAMSETTHTHRPTVVHERANGDAPLGDPASPSLPRSDGESHGAPDEASLSLDSAVSQAKKLFADNPVLAAAGVASLMALAVLVARRTPSEQVPALGDINRQLRRMAASQRGNVSDIADTMAAMISRIVAADPKHLAAVTSLAERAVGQAHQSIDQLLGRIATR